MKIVKIMKIIPPSSQCNQSFSNTRRSRKTFTIFTTFTGVALVLAQKRHGATTHTRKEAMKCLAVNSLYKSTGPKCMKKA